MKPIWRFRLLALLIVVVVGTVSIANLAAEWVRPARPPVPARGNAPPAPDQISAAALAATIAPFREDLKADDATLRAAEALASDDTRRAQVNEPAQTAVRAALGIGPHDSRMWLVLALLQARGNLGDAQIAESLKMSYLTGPNEAELIPARLDLVTVGNSLGDPELQELATGDVRAVLTRFPDLLPLLAKDYARSSAAGRKFLEDSTRTLDPKFADTLRGAR